MSTYENTNHPTNRPSNHKARKNNKQGVELSNWNTSDWEHKGCPVNRVTYDRNLKNVRTER